MLKRSLIPILTIILLSPAATTEATAQTPSASHRAHVLQLLRARNGFPTQKSLLRTGRIANTNRILTELAESKPLSPYLRLNAIRALEYFPTRRTEEVLMVMLYAKYQTAVFKRTILRSLARSFGVKQYFEILPFLRDDNAAVRAGAAMALAEIDDGRVRSVLTNRLAREPDLNARIALERAIRLIDKRERSKRHTIKPGQ